MAGSERSNQRHSGRQGGGGGPSGAGVQHGCDGGSKSGLAPSRLRSKQGLVKGSTKGKIGHSEDGMSLSRNSGNSRLEYPGNLIPEFRNFRSSGKRARAAGPPVGGVAWSEGGLERSTPCRRGEAARHDERHSLAATLRFGGTTARPAGPDSDIAVRHAPGTGRRPLPAGGSDLWRDEEPVTRRGCVRSARRTFGAPPSGH